STRTGLRLHPSGPWTAVRFPGITEAPQSASRRLPMLAVVAATWALLLGMAFIMTGNGLLVSLLGVRATVDHFPTAVTGVVQTCYYVGFLVGSLLAPRAVQRVGHIRVFAALAALVAAASLVHALFVDAVVWGGMRMVAGFAYAGLYVVAESWLNDRSSN